MSNKMSEDGCSWLVASRTSLDHPNTPFFVWSWTSQGSWCEHFNHHDHSYTSRPSQPRWNDWSGNKCQVLSLVSRNSNGKLQVFHEVGSPSCYVRVAKHLPGIPTTIKTMGVNITTIVYLKVLITQIGSTIVLMVVQAKHLLSYQGLDEISPEGPAVLPAPQQ